MWRASVRARHGLCDKRQGASTTLGPTDIELEDFVDKQMQFLFLVLRETTGTTLAAVVGDSSEG